jgi:predicted nucleic acid-binding protein
MIAAPQTVVLDTGVYGRLLLPGTPIPGSAKWRDALAGMTVVIAVQTRAELLFGAGKSGWGERRVADLRTQLDRTPTIPVSEEVVEAYASLRSQRHRTGHALAAKIHNGDLWIAASAIAIQAPLASDDGIFVDAPGLVLL